MKQKSLSKKANMAVSKAVKIITSVVLGSAMMAGLCVTVKKTVLPTATTKVESMFGVTGDITEDLGGGVFPTTDRFDDGPCDSYYYDTLQNAVADASAHTTANANATESTGKAYIDVRQSDDMYIVKPMEDQTVASSLQMSNKMIFDTNGKQIQLAAGAEFKPQAGSEITFRDSGTGKIYKDVDSSSTEILVNAQNITNCTVNVLNGTYSLKNKTGNAFVFRNGGVTYIKKGSFSSETEDGVSMTLALTNAFTVEGGSYYSKSTANAARCLQLSGSNGKISGSNLESVSVESYTQSVVVGNSTVEINNCKIASKATSKTSANSCAQTITLTSGTNSLTLNNSTVSAESVSTAAKRAAIDSVVNIYKGNNSCIINGGKYTVSSKAYGGYGILSKSLTPEKVKINGGEFTASVSEGEGIAIMDINSINNAKVKTYATNDSKTHKARAYGIFYGSNFQGNPTVENTTVVADYNLESVSVNDDYTCKGISVNSSSQISSLTLNNCNIKATREAIGSIFNGNLYINGGTYEGIQHGGAYFSCNKVVAKNATFRKWNYDGQFNKDNFYSYNAAFYIGTASREVKVFMDNCKLENATNAVLSSNYSCKNTYLYASNTAFNNIRIDGANSAGDKGHMFIGKGSTYKSTSGSGALDTTTYSNVEFTPEYVKNNFN